MESTSLNSANIEQANEEMIRHVFSNAMSFASSFTFVKKASLDSDGDSVMNEPEALPHNYKIFLSENAEFNKDVNFEPYSIDFSTLKKAFEKANTIFGAEGFKQALEILADKIDKEFLEIVQEEMFYSLMFASRSLLMLLQLDQLFDLDWF